MTSLARVLAAEKEEAQRLGTVRHLHISSQPLVLVPLTLAGETNAPLAAMVGDHRDRPQVIVVSRPRVRAERLMFAEHLASPLLRYITNLAAQQKPVPPTSTRRRNTGPRLRAVEAPQVWVPNPGGIDFLRLLGRMTRFRRTVGEWAVPPSVPRLGIWATWLAEEAEYVDSCTLVAATRALADVWATGQSQLEDGNLPALMAWIAPPEGLSVGEAVTRADDPITCPPAGPSTDPSFDEQELEPALRMFEEATSEAAREVVRSRLGAVLERQMRPTWDLVWQAMDLLREVPPGRSVESRWEANRTRFTDFAQYVDDRGLPQSKRDGAVKSARRLHDLELRLAIFDAQRAFDDPMVMAEYRLAGEAFQGIVTAAEPDRIVRPDSRRVLRPRITVLTRDLFRFAPGDTGLHDPNRPDQEAQVMDVTATGKDEYLVVLELTRGMGRGLTPPPGTVPSVGEQVTYAQLDISYTPRGQFPSIEVTPWTHGGPPEEFKPLPEDATEVWGNEH